MLFLPKAIVFYHDLKRPERAQLDLVFVGPDNRESDNPETMRVNYAVLFGEGPHLVKPPGHFDESLTAECPRISLSVHAFPRLPRRAIDGLDSGLCSAFNVLDKNHPRFAEFNLRWGDCEQNINGWFIQASSLKSFSAWRNGCRDDIPRMLKEIAGRTGKIFDERLRELTLKSPEQHVGQYVERA